MLQCAASQGLFVPGGLHFLQTSANSFASDALVKSFTMDDRRLKQPGGGDYFDELLARIRDIRSGACLLAQGAGY
jgi:hypothetical protein